jgi:riboflavin kinase/FMN adenylyltransferase
MCEGRSVVITFDPHPSEIASTGRPAVALLTTLEERVAMLETLEIDLLWIIRFTPEFSALSSKEFYESYVVNGVGVSEVVVGYDHMFGRKREAGVQELLRMGRLFSFSVYAADSYKVQGTVVSSTRIRTLLLHGDLEGATALLGYSYGLTGKVIRGDGRGATIGYPTANIQPVSPRKLVPGRGVYLVGVELQRKQMFGMMNIGVRPTLTDGSLQAIEVHVFGLEHEIYGSELRITFLRKLREEQQFSSLNELVTQLHRDKEESLKHIEQYRKSS